MDQAHDIAHYFDRGLRPSGGRVTMIVQPTSDLAAITGWAKDQPFTAIVFIGAPDEVQRVNTDGLLAELDRAHNDLPPLDWEH